ncbi:MAG: branched-chain amino acid ABC transporter permease [Xanthomonadaceae bacterium]|nr:branched-chain amino acid ABC transporter permease [Xanthomonadaceae bacterium]
MDLSQLLFTGVAQGCIYGLIALGFVLIYKATEMVNFAQGDLMMIGAFVAFTLIAGLGLPYWLGLLGAVLVLAAAGYLLDVVLLRPLSGQPAFAVVILTISLGFVLRAVAGVVWGHNPVSFATPFSGKLLTVGPAMIAQENVAIIFGTLLLCGLLYLFFRHTRVGVAMQAVAQNQLAAYYMGIPVKRLSSTIWAISAAVAAVAGVLMAPVALIEPQMGFLGIKAFAAAVIGGFGSLPGALLGGLIVGLGEQFAGAWLGQGFKEATAYLLMLTVLVMRPGGLLAQVRRKKV